MENNEPKGTGSVVENTRMGSQNSQVVTDNDASGNEQIFPPTVKLIPCAQNTCSAGHHWPAQLVIVKCPGCGSQAVAARMVNCPVCNEPQASLRFRLDHIVDGNGVLPVCRGVKGFHNHAFIDLNFHHSEVAMENYNTETGKVELPKENACV